MPLEKSIEKQFVKKLKALGCMVRKVEGSSNVGWPDRLILVPGGVTVLIEMKKPGGKLSPVQEAFFEDAKEIGHDHHRHFDNWQEALAYVRSLM